MPIEVLFVGILEGIAKDALKHSIREAIRAVSEAEILQTDLNRLISEPFRSANVHLENAALELENDLRQQEHVEYARHDFIKASQQDAPLPAARAAFYVGLCHHLRKELRHELYWYELSLSMLSKIEGELGSL